MENQNKALVATKEVQSTYPSIERLAEKVLTAARSGELRQGFTMREVLRKHWGGATQDTMSAAINYAIADGRLERRKVVTTGRPRFGYFTPAANIPAADAVSVATGSMIDDFADRAADLADERDSALLAAAVAESRLRHQSADYERRIADLTRQAAAAEMRAHAAEEAANKVMLAAMEAACFNSRLLASRGIEVAS